MKRFTAIAAGLAVMAALIATGVVSAHAPITHIQWDRDTNPTRLIASTNNREMVADAGAWYLRVYNSSGARVDNGDAVMSPDRLEIHVSLQPNLPGGSYRVDWLTTSKDGAVLSGSESVPLPGSFGEPPSAATPEESHGDEGAGEEPSDEGESTEAPVAPPATGDGGLADSRGVVERTSALPGPIAVIIAAGWLVAVRRRSQGR